MGLLHEIQASVLKEEQSLASILLQLQLLASRLGSKPLAAWIRQELEGYDAREVPAYRIAGVVYRGTFSEPFGSHVKNAPIPPDLIEQIAGEHWTRRPMTDSISAISKLARSDDTIRVDGSNLIHLLQGKIYPDRMCNEVLGIISNSDLVRILDVVRSRVLDFTIAIEKEHPEVRQVDSLGNGPDSGGAVTAGANRLVQQTIYAQNVTNAFSFEDDLERILLDRVERSDKSEKEKTRMVDLVKSAGVQEAVKQILQNAPDLLRLLALSG